MADWIGNRQVAVDRISGFAAQALRHILGTSAPTADETAPPLAHWLGWLTSVPPTQIGPDGHVARGGFLPPVELPRRMWAGSRLSFARPLSTERDATRTSTVTKVEEKTGRSGRLVFVEVEHQLSDADGLLLREQQDIVYRDAPDRDAPSPAPVPAPADPHWTRRIDPDPVLLFRYSALTYNGHRIHYDQPYATTVEGYPGLVVHGPLIATYLLHTLLEQRPGATVVEYEFRAVRPVFDTAPFFVCGSLLPDGRAELFAKDQDGALCMRALARLR